MIGIFFYDGLLNNMSPYMERYITNQMSTKTNVPETVILLDGKNGWCYNNAILNKAKTIYENIAIFTNMPCFLNEGIENGERLIWFWTTDGWKYIDDVAKIKIKRKSDIMKLYLKGELIE